MVKEAEAHAAEDARRKQEIELRNQTDSLVYSTERSLAEHGAKLSDADRSAVEQALSEAREALKSEDMSRIERARQSLTQASQKFAEALYRSTSGDGGAGSGGASGTPGGDVVDAEFRDVGE
jgi:molecular chaperone DnaK